MRMVESLAVSPSLYLTTLLTVGNMSRARTWRVTKRVARREFRNNSFMHSLSLALRFTFTTVCFTTKKPYQTHVHCTSVVPLVIIIHFHPRPLATAGVGRTSTSVPRLRLEEPLQGEVSCS